MKLVKTTGGASEGAGVIEAILSWWNTFRTDSNEDTSANLFKKSASLTDEDRLTFVESMQRVGVSTISAVQTTVASAEGEQGSRQGATNSAQAKNSMAKSGFIFTKAKDRILPWCGQHALPWETVAQRGALGSWYLSPALNR